MTGEAEGVHISNSQQVGSPLESKPRFRNRYRMAKWKRSRRMLLLAGNHNVTQRVKYRVHRYGCVAIFRRDRKALTRFKAFLTVQECLPNGNIIPTAALTEIRRSGH